MCARLVSHVLIGGRTASESTLSWTCVRKAAPASTGCVCVRVCVQAGAQYGALAPPGALIFHPGSLPGACSGHLHLSTPFSENSSSAVHLLLHVLSPVPAAPFYRCWTASHQRLTFVACHLTWGCARSWSRSSSREKPRRLTASSTLLARPTSSTRRTSLRKRMLHTSWLTA